MTYALKPTVFETGEKVPGDMFQSEARSRCPPVLREALDIAGSAQALATALGWKLNAVNNRASGYCYVSFTQQKELNAYVKGHKNVD